MSGQTLIKKKRPLSLVEYLLIGLVFMTLLVFLVGFIGFSAWMQTYKALTAERTVGELSIGGKVFIDGVPSFEMTYKVVNEKPLLSFYSEVTPDEYKMTMKGDQVFVDANFIRWADWVKLTGISPAYKVYRIKSDFSNLSDRDRFRSSAMDLNGGADNNIKNFDDSGLEWLVQSAFISSAGIDVKDQSQKFYVKVTNDALVLEKML